MRLLPAASQQSRAALAIRIRAGGSHELLTAQIGQLWAGSGPTCVEDKAARNGGDARLI
jgi:hypothetical protein